MTRILRIFRPEVEVAIKVAFLVALAMAYLVTFSWGYEGRQQARHWREVACEARLDDGHRPCETLDRAGIKLARVSRETLR